MNPRVAGAGISLPLPGSAPQPSEPRTTATERAGIAAARSPSRDRAVQRARDYVTLTKPRIISLLLVTTVIPMVVATGGWPTLDFVLWTCLGGYLMAGGANALNMFIDRDIDAQMTRTALRPIPSGRVSGGHGLAYAIAISTAAFLVFWWLVNPLSASLALAGLVYYVGIYTLWLKRRTPQNIVIGGGAGAFPPLVGWAAVTGTLDWTPFIFFLIVVLWTPPHFWALALVKEKEYRRVAVPMAPNAWGAEKTIQQMRWYTVALVMLSLTPMALGHLGAGYGFLALVLGGWFLRDVNALARSGDRIPAAWRVYKTSLLYLALLFLAMVVDVAVAA